MAETELERIYTIPFRKVKDSSRNGRADRAVRELRAYLIRHMKSDDIWIDDAVNQAIWARGKFTIPSRLRVRAVKFDDGVVEVSLPEEEAMTSIREQLKEERESKAPVLPAAPPEGAEDETEEDAIAEIEAEPEEQPGKPELEAAKPEEEPAAAAEKKAPKATKKADEESAATPSDAGKERHEHGEEEKKDRPGEAQETHD